MKALEPVSDKPILSPFGRGNGSIELTSAERLARQMETLDERVSCLERGKVGSEHTAATIFGEGPADPPSEDLPRFIRSGTEPTPKYQDLPPQEGDEQGHTEPAAPVAVGNDPTVQALKKAHQELAQLLHDAVKDVTDFKNYARVRFQAIEAETDPTPSRKHYPQLADVLGLTDKSTPEEWHEAIKVFRERVA